MRLIVALALLLVMSPGGTELVELAVHLVAHGDLPHHEGVEDGDCREHACTPLRHQCSCHSTMSAQATVRQAPPIPSRTGVVIAIKLATIAGGRANEPPLLRPPIG